MRTVDINSDIGESFGSWVIGDGVDNALMTIISSANIATGFHAGDPNIMHRTVGGSEKNNVAIGAHPGFHDLQGFGRRHLSIPTEELVNDIIYQLGALREFARLYALPLQHIKPHGALYMHRRGMTRQHNILSPPCINSTPVFISTVWRTRRSGGQRSGWNTR